MDKPVTQIIEEMRKASEATITAAGEGKKINLANLTTLIDSWRFSLEKTLGA
jgi:hypothetical protein